MFDTQFPDLVWLKNEANRRFTSQRDFSGKKLEHPGWPTVILNVKSKAVYRDDILGPLSLFSNQGGESIVIIDGKRTVINADTFFISNPGQRYTLEIEKHNQAETFNIHFGEHWLTEVHHSLSNTFEYLLDNGPHVKTNIVNFYNHLHYKNEFLRELNSKLIQTKHDSLKKDELLYELLCNLLEKEIKVRNLPEKIDAIKTSTREEILKRLLLATDYIFTFYKKDISLDELAKVGCMSKFHFLRVFKVVFQKTPHEFISDLRLEKSKELLKIYGHDIKYVANAIGFNNTSSFSRFFYQKTGVYPSQFKGK